MGWLAVRWWGAGPHKKKPQFERPGIYFHPPSLCLLACSLLPTLSPCLRFLRRLPRLSRLLTFASAPLATSASASLATPLILPRRPSLSRSTCSLCKKLVIASSSLPRQSCRMFPSFFLQPLLLTRAGGSAHFPSTRARCRACERSSSASPCWRRAGASARAVACWSCSAYMPTTGPSFSAQALRVQAAHPGSAPSCYPGLRTCSKLSCLTTSMRRSRSKSLPCPPSSTASFIQQSQAYRLPRAGSLPRCLFRVLHADGRAALASRMCWRTMAAFIRRVIDYIWTRGIPAAAHEKTRVDEKLRLLSHHHLLWAAIMVPSPPSPDCEAPRLSLRVPNLRAAKDHQRTSFVRLLD